MKQEGTTKGYSVPNLERALEIIETLTIHRNGLTLTQLQELLSFPKSSIFRIISTLTERGYLLKSQVDGRFTLSKKFLRIGLSTMNESSIVETTLPYMRAIRDELNETVLLGALIDKKGVILEQVVGNQGFTFVLTVGNSYQLHASAPGKAVIAFLPKEEQEAVIDTFEWTRFNDRTITTKKEYQEELISVREHGYALDRAEELDGVYCVGAPIFNQYGYPIAAMWVTAPSARLDLSHLCEAGEKIKTMALEVSKIYGYEH